MLEAGAEGGEVDGGGGGGGHVRASPGRLVTERLLPPYPCSVPPYLSSYAQQRIMSLERVGQRGAGGRAVAVAPYAASVLDLA
eukprot:171523-Rhodomonas_salina.1